MVKIKDLRAMSVDELEARTRRVQERATEFAHSAGYRSAAEPVGYL